MYRLIFRGAASMLLAGLPAFSQTVTITPWKDGARAAYSVTMDDFCLTGARGIAMHADSLFRNRNMTFGFGAIVGFCRERDWGIAKTLLAHGHEVLNHSWTHGCPRTESWCAGPAWEGARLAKEIDSAGLEIERHLGRRPLFFLFPFDIWTPGQITHLKSRGYLGARSGALRDVNRPEFTDPFDLNFDAVHPTANRHFQRFALGALIDSAIRSGGWAIRETHGVADGSYGSLSVAELRQHLDYAKAKSDSGLLWVAGPVAVLKYRKQAGTYSPAMRMEGNEIEIAWHGAPLDSNLFDGELTLSLESAGSFAGGTASQAGLPLKIREGPDRILINARPHRGPVRLARRAAADPG